MQYMNFIKKKFVLTTLVAVFGTILQTSAQLSQIATVIGAAGGEASSGTGSKILMTLGEPVIGNAVGSDEERLFAGFLNSNLAYIPVNDDCSNAVAVTDALFPFKDSINLDFATPESNDPEPTCINSGGNPGGHSVWYTLTTASNRTINVNTFCSDIDTQSFDTILAVYTGSCGNLTQIACNDNHDDVGGDRVSQIVFEAQAGITYFIQAVDRAGSLNAGNLEISINENSAADFFEVDDTPPQASYLETQSLESQCHNFHDAGDEDWVLFFVENNLDIINVENVGEDAQIELKIFHYLATGPGDELFTFTADSIGDEINKSINGNFEDIGLPTDSFYLIQVTDINMEFGPETHYCLTLGEGTNDLSGRQIQGIFVNYLGEIIPLTIKLFDKADCDDGSCDDQHGEDYTDAQNRTFIEGIGTMIYGLTTPESGTFTMVASSPGYKTQHIDVITNDPNIESNIKAIVLCPQNTIDLVPETNGDVRVPDFSFSQPYYPFVTIEQNPEPGILISGSSPSVEVKVTHDTRIQPPSDINSDECNISFSGPNLLPVAFDDDIDGTSSTSSTGNVLFDNGNGADILGDEPTTVTSFDQSSTQGTVNVDPDGLFTYSPPPNFCGVDSFDYTITDSNGDTDTATVRVDVVDTTDPEITTCPSPPADLSANSNCQAALPDLTGGVSAMDNCTTTPTISQEPLAGTLIGLGPTTVTLTATDGAGLTDTCQVDVTVVDTTDPEITTCPSPPADLSANSNCQAALPDLTGGVSAMDNCTTTPTISQEPLAGTLIGLGPTTVTLTATDGAGLTDTCQVDVTVVDTTDPEITTCPSPPADLSANSNCQAALPDLTGGVSAMDNCTTTPTISQEPLAGTLIGLGPTTVTLTATDGAGLTDTCQVDVTVVDTTDPEITTCPSPPADLSANSNCQAALPDLTGGVSAMDNCTTTPTISQEPLAGTLIGLGPTTVTLTATDGAGLTDTCQVDVTVVDTTDPEITTCPSPPADLSANSNCQAALPDLTGGVSAMDNCTTTPTISQEPLAGTLIGLGPTTVTLTATDGAGLTDTCQVDVTVVDTTDPEITTCPSPPADLSANSNCQAALPDLTGGVSAMDNCTTTPTISQEPLAGTLIGLGPTTVTLTATDGAGLTDTCQVDVTVVDTTEPVISLKDANPQTIQLGNAYTELGATATDNCEVIPEGNIMIDSSSVDTSIVDTYSVTYDVSDSSGNAASQVTRTVNVVDTENPIASVSVSTDPVTDGNLGQTVMVTYNKTMNTGMNPSVSFTGLISDYMLAEGEWSGSDLVYTVSRMLNDDNETSTGTVNVSGAQDVNGNEQVPDGSINFLLILRIRPYQLPIQMITIL